MGLAPWNASKGEVERLFTKREVAARLVLGDIRFVMGDVALMMINAATAVVGL